MHVKNSILFFLSTFIGFTIHHEVEVNNGNKGYMLTAKHQFRCCWAQRKRKLSNNLSNAWSFTKAAKMNGIYMVWSMIIGFLCYICDNVKQMINKTAERGEKPEDLNWEKSHPSPTKCQYVSMSDNETLKRQLLKNWNPLLTIVAIIFIIVVNDR